VKVGVNGTEGLAGKAGSMKPSARHPADSMNAFRRESLFALYAGCKIEGLALSLVVCSPGSALEAALCTAGS